jgi:hypothetical protein
MFRGLILAAVASSLLGLAACAADAQTDEPASDQPIQTPSAYGHSTVEHAAEAPLHDLNIVRQKIPPVLLAAMADPYARVPRASCRTLDVRLADLEAALGPDFDEPGTVKDASLRGKTGTTALSLAHAGAESLLPYSGFIATLTGAQRRDALVLEAIISGNTRRAYLKGLGEAHGCRPPDAPRHLLVPAPPVEVSHNRPLYPIN